MIHSIAGDSNGNPLLQALILYPCLCPQGRAYSHHRHRGPGQPKPLPPRSRGVRDEARGHLPRCRRHLGQAVAQQGPLVLRPLRDCFAPSSAQLGDTPSGQVPPSGGGAEGVAGCGGLGGVAGFREFSPPKLRGDEVRDSIEHLKVLDRARPLNVRWGGLQIPFVR